MKDNITEGKDHKDHLYQDFKIRIKDLHMERKIDFFQGVTKTP